MKKHLLILFIILFSRLQGFGQSHAIDSLRNVLKTEKDDTNKVKTLNKLSIKLRTIDKYDTAIVYATSACELAEQLDFKKGEETACKNLGNIYDEQSNYFKAIEYDSKGLAIAQEIGDKTSIANTLGNIGVIYYRQGNYPTALEYFLKALAMSQEIGNKISITSNLGDIGLIYYSLSNYPKALEYNLKALIAARELGEKSYISSILSNIGNIYDDEGNYPKSFEYDSQALATAREVGDTTSILMILGNMGDVYQKEGYYPKALEYDLQALTMARKMGDKSNIAIILGNMGSNYTMQKNYTQGRIYLDSSLHIAKNIGAKNAIKAAYSSMAALDSATGNYKTAFEEYKEYIICRDSLLNDANKQTMMQTQMNYDFKRKIDSTKAEQDKKDNMVSADKRKQETITELVSTGLFLVLVLAGFIFRSLRITRKQKEVIEIKRKETEDQRKVIELVGQIGQKITSSLNLGEVIETLHGYISSVMDASGLTIYIYNPETECIDLKYVLGKHGGVIEHSIPLDSKESFCVYSFTHKQAILVNDVSKEYSKYLSNYYWSSVPNTEIICAFINIPLIVGDKTIGVISVQSFHTNVYTKEHLEILKSLGAFMSVALNNADAYTQLNFAKENLAKQKALVEEKNKDILDSITYAKRLQDAILPPLSIIKQYLPESFVLYKPKDIIAGDFYWIERSGDTILIAAADCTGHGVPGALVSVVCSNALNRTVKEFHITEPGKILDKVRELVLETFEKSEANVQDGMDISLCCINTKTKKMQWSGAYNSLLYIQQGEIHEITADKQPIGKIDQPQPFNTHNLNLQKGNTLYLFTDGYADQFGGSKGKKFKYKQLQDILLANASKNMEEQKNILESTLKEWKGTLEQVDDVLVMGIRI